METAWGLEGDLQKPSSLVDAALTVKEKTGLNTQARSTRSNDPLFRHQHARRELGGRSALAIVLAALALTYLLATCMRRLSKNLKGSSQQLRQLASDFPGEDEDGNQCPKPSGDGVQESATSIPEGDASDAAEPPGAAAAAQPEEMGAADLPPEGTPVQTRRCLPAATQTLVEKTVLLLQRPAEVVKPLLPLMPPERYLSLLKILCKFAAGELSAFATAPSPLQPLRQQAAALYVGLIDEALNTEATAQQADRRGWRRELESLLVLLQGLAKPSPETETIPAKEYSMIMECQQRVAHYAISQVLHSTDMLTHIVNTGHAVEAKQALFKQLQVLGTLCRARLLQILNGATTRFWLQKQQTIKGVTVVYLPHDLTEARFQKPGTTVERIEAITAAILAAGGLPTSQWAPLPLTKDEQQQLPQEHQDLSQQVHQPHEKPPEVHPADAYVLLPTPFTPLAGHHPQVQLPQIPHMTPHGQPPHAPGQTLLLLHPAQQGAAFPPVLSHSQLVYHLVPFWQQQQGGGQQGLSTQMTHRQHPGQPRPPPQAYDGLPTHGAPTVRLPPTEMPQPSQTTSHDHQPPPVGDPTLLSFDPGQQDSEFPAVNPDPQLSGYYTLSEQRPALQIPLPPVYSIPHPFPPRPTAPLSSGSAAVSPGDGAGDLIARSHHGSSTGEPQPARPSSQEPPAGPPDTSSSEVEDA
ncbi:hypothetical protein ACSSS7_000348 [Eimeria intestinalis]